MRRECRERSPPPPPPPPQISVRHVRDVRAVMHTGIATGGSFEVGGGKTSPAFSVHAQPAILRIW